MNDSVSAPAHRGEIQVHRGHVVAGRRSVSVKETVEALNQGILSGRILETFETYYADDIVMCENGGDERVGKTANRAYEEAFVANVEFHGAEVKSVLVDGNRSAVEWVFDLTPKGGSRIQQRQVAMQTWKDGRIVREDFYFGG
jgi:ketosteroid isomerase-like protein